MKKLLWNKETVRYLFFGILTMIINYTVFVGAFFILGEEKTLSANTISFILATFFAYVTNKIWVFNIHHWKIKKVIEEIISFSGVRVLSFFFEQIGLSICINILHVGEYTIGNFNGVIVTKIILSFIVVVINYVLSKFFIFHKA